MVYDSDKFATFVFLRTNRAYSFTGYTDKDGIPQYINDGEDVRTGLPRKRRFKFRNTKRFLKIPRQQQDKEGRNVVEFLRNHPECLNSPNGSYVEGKQLGVFFKEMDEDKDAEIIVKDKALRKKATDIAFSLEGEELYKMAVMCGCKSSKPTTQTMRVIEFAESAPQAFIDMYESNDTKIRAILRDGVVKGIIHKVGTMLKWENITLGGDETAAVAKLIDDEHLLDAISNAVNNVRSSNKEEQKESQAQLAEQALERKKQALAKAREAKAKKNK